LKLARIIIITLILFSSLTLTYFTVWRAIIMLPSTFTPIRIPRLANATDISELEVQTSVRSFILRWGLIPVYTSDRGDLIPTHRVFITFISILSLTLAYLIDRGIDGVKQKKGNHRRTTDPWDID